MTIAAAFADNSGQPAVVVSRSIDSVALTSPVVATAQGFSFQPDAPLPDGFHTVEILAADAAGNPAAASQTFRVDTVPPVLTSISENITADAVGSGANVSYAAASATDDVTVQPAVSYSAPTGSFFPIGATTVTVTATDQAGNSASGAFTITVRDVTPPVGTFIVPAHGSLVNDMRLRFIGSMSDSSGIAPSITARSLDGQGITTPLTVSSDWFYFDAPDLLNDGPHVVTATISDSAGNLATAQASFTVDLRCR